MVQVQQLLLGLGRAKTRLTVIVIKGKTATRQKDVSDDCCGAVDPDVADEERIRIVEQDLDGVRPADGAHLVGKVIQLFYLSSSYDKLERLVRLVFICDSKFEGHLQLYQKSYMEQLHNSHESLARIKLFWWV